MKETFNILKNCKLFKFLDNDLNKFDSLGNSVIDWKILVNRIYNFKKQIL